MIYGSICSGIESASLALEPLGWQPRFFSEIESSPCAVLRERWPGVPLHGDFRTIKKDSYEKIDALIGGTPCQDFSLAGLRKGLAGDRGNLSIEFLLLAKRLRPAWLVWENVPGILSIDEGKAFGIFLGKMAELGYGFAYRVLDAQYFGVAQRRRRVFVVGYFGDWRPPAAVLFERESLCGDLAPIRSAREGAACDVRSGAAGTLGAHKTGGWGVTDIDVAGAYIPEITHSLRGEGFDASEDGSGRGVPLASYRMQAFGKYEQDDIAGSLKSRDHKDATDLIAIPILEAGGRTSSKPIPINTQLGLRGPDTSNSVREGIGIGESGDPMFTLQAAHQHAVAFDCKASGGRGFAADSAQAPTLRAMTGKKANGGGQVAVAFESRYARNGRGAPAEITSSLKAQSGQTGKGDGAPLTQQGMAVRRLTPRECERLMALPDDYTLVPYRGRMMADGPRYRMIGNSMAVTPMRKIGDRINLIRKLMGK